MLGGALRSERKQAWLLTATETEHMETRNYRSTIINYIHRTSVPFTKKRGRFQDYSVVAGLRSQTKKKLLIGYCYHQCACAIIFVQPSIIRVSITQVRSLCLPFLLSRFLLASVFLFRSTTLFVRIFYHPPTPASYFIRFSPRHLFH